jgi:RNA methyltransferase, TrmH family
MHFVPDTVRLRKVTSRQNSLVQELRRAFARSEPTPGGFHAIEGVRIIEEAIRSGLRFHAVFVSQSAEPRAHKLLPQIAANVETLLLPDEVFQSAVPTETPQGVAALVKLKEFGFDDLFIAPIPLVIVAVGLQDPGNLGTLVRSAEAFGASGLVVAERTVDPLNAKAVRASAGSIFRLPLVRANLNEALGRLRDRGLRLIATSSHNAMPADEAELTGPLALLIGNEGAGLDAAVRKSADATVLIPHSAKVDSLNAGVAASILLYEIARQRKGGAS